MLERDKQSSYRWVVAGISFVAQFSNALTALAIAPLAAIFQPELGLSKAQVGFFSSAAFAGAWGMLLIAGSFTDRFGVRKMMTLGQVVSGIFVLAMASVGAFVQATVVMLCAGVGRGITGPGITKSVVDWFPPVGRATAVAINQSAIPVAGIATAAILPPLALTIGWRGASATLGGVILIGAVATAILYRDRAVREPRAVDRGVKANLGGALKNGRLWAVAAAGPLYSGVQFSLTTYLALYYKEVVLVPLVPDERARIVAAGSYLALGHLGSVMARMGWGFVGDRLFPGRRMVLLSVAGMLAAVASVGMGCLQPTTSVPLTVSVAFLAGAAMMGNQALYMLVAAETAGARYAASGVGLCMTGTQLGFVGAPTLFGFVLDSTGSYGPAWLGLAGVSVCGATVTGVLAQRSGRPALASAETST